MWGGRGWLCLAEPGEHSTEEVALELDLRDAEVTGQR